MKSILLGIAALGGRLLTGCAETDVGMAVEAGKDAVRAATLTDEEVQRLTVQVARKADQKHAVAPADNPYARRLERLVGRGGEYDGRTFNDKVYLSPKVNPFAMVVIRRPVPDRSRHRP